MSTTLQRAQWAGLLFLAGGMTFVLALHLAEMTFPGYSVSRNWISDLGQSCAYTGTNWPHDCVYVQPAATIFAAAAVTFGGLMVTGAVLLYPLRRFRRISVLTGLVGLGAVGVALFPEGDPVPHAAFAGLILLPGALAAIESFRHVPRVMGFVFLVLASIALIAFAILITVGGGTVAPTWTPLGKGGMERMAAYPELLWIIAFGATLLGSPASLAQPSLFPTGTGVSPRDASGGPVVPGRPAKPPG